MKTQIDILLVTEELFPYTKGGIGKITDELRKGYEIHGHSCLVLLITNLDIVDKPDWLLVFDPESIPNQIGFPQFEAFKESESHALALKVWFQIRILLEVYKFKFIEFPDFKGIGTSTINELSLLDERPRIVTRIHSSDFTLRKFDAQFASNQSSLLRYNSESLQILNSDFVIAHTQGVATKLLEDLELLIGRKQVENVQKRLIVKFPFLPYLSKQNHENSNYNQWDKSKIVFTSKFQFFKNPRMFARATTNFVCKFPNYFGKIYFLAHSTDWTLRETIEQEIPENIKHKFEFREDESSASRNRLIDSSLAIFTTTHESLCLAAYEASLAGAIPILNARCASFDTSSPWVDKENCVMFDGNTDDLVEKLTKLYKNDAKVKKVDIDLHSSCFYCEQIDKVALPKVTTSSLDEGISILIAHRNMSLMLIETLSDLLEKIEIKDEILIIDDGSNLNELRKIRDASHEFQNIKLHEIGSNFGLSAARNIGVKLAKHEVIIILDADDFLTREFINASRKLSRASDVDVLVPQVEMFQNEKDLNGFDKSVQIVFEGQGHLAAISKNRVGSATIAAKKETLKQVNYRENLTTLEDWSLLFDLGDAGKSIRLFERIGLRYRYRSDSMMRSVHSVDFQRDFDQVQSKIPLPGYALTSLGYKQAGPNLSHQKLLKRIIITAIYINKARLVSLSRILSKAPLLGSTFDKFTYRARNWIREN